MKFIILILTIAFVFYLIVRRFADQSRRPAQEEPFNQAGVKVSYSNGTIAIDKDIYDVNQVTKVQMNPYQSAREYQESTAEKVIIEIDDSLRPKHQIKFRSSSQAEHFMLKLIRALKLAGSPKSI